MGPLFVFEDGTPVGYDESEAGARMTVSQDGDTYKILIGESRFELPDAVMTGG